MKTPSSKSVTKKSSPKKSKASHLQAPSKPVLRPPARKKSTPRAGHDMARLEKLVVNALENLKGKDIVRIDVHKLTDIMDTLIIASGTSSRHVKSLADNARLELKKNGYKAYGSEGEDAGEWVLVDFGGLVLHVMQPHVREFYDLEKLWGTPSAPKPNQTEG